MKLLFKASHRGLRRAVLRGLPLVELGDGTFARDVQPAEFILKITHFPWPSDQIIVQLDARFQRDPLANKLPILLRCSFRSPQCDQVLVDGLKGNKEVRWNSLNTPSHAEDAENCGKPRMCLVTRHAVRYLFLAGLPLPTFASAFCISADTLWLMS